MHAIINVLKSLNWFPVHPRICFKLGFIAYKTFQKVRSYLKHELDGLDFSKASWLPAFWNSLSLHLSCRLMPFHSLLKNYLPIQIAYLPHDADSLLQDILNWLPPGFGWPSLDALALHIRAIGVTKAYHNCYYNYNTVTNYHYNTITNYYYNTETNYYYNYNMITNYYYNNNTETIYYIIIITMQ